MGSSEPIENSPPGMNFMPFGAEPGGSSWLSFGGADWTTAAWAGGLLAGAGLLSGAGEQPVVSISARTIGGARRASAPDGLPRVRVAGRIESNATGWPRRRQGSIREHRRDPRLLESYVMTCWRRIPTPAALLLALCACGGGGPRAALDWRMADRTLDEETDQRGSGDADTPGPDGVVDDYDNAQGPLLPGINGNISTKFPEDGRYDVVLDGCASAEAARYLWFVDGDPPFETSDCETRVRLAEGPHSVGLTVRDASGGSDTRQLAIDVRDLIVVGLGDSFSAGSGDSRSGLVAADYDQIRCTRSGRSGQARAALELERRDTKTSVTFIHLACGGARADAGLLGAHNNQPPQLLELEEILPPGEVVDFVSFTIGGNDVRFSEIIGQLVGEPDAPISILQGQRLHDLTQGR